jgi:hypothetical protein
VLAKDDYERVGKMSKTKGLIKAFLITAMLLAGLIFLTGGGAAKVAAKAHGFLFPVYSQVNVIHRVADGDTLYGIAYQYSDKQNKWDDLRGVVCDIEEANNLGKNRSYLHPGQQIIVPLYNKI